MNRWLQFRHARVMWHWQATSASDYAQAAVRQVRDDSELVSDSALADWACQRHTTGTCQFHAIPKVKNGRRGLTLLEVILALAILSGAVAVLGESIRHSLRNASSSADLTKAQLLCETKVSEVVAGVMPAEATGPTVFETPGDEDWLYTIEVEEQLDADLPMLLVKVTTEQSPDRFSHPVRFSLTRWLAVLPQETTTDMGTIQSGTGTQSSAGAGGTGTGTGTGGNR